MFQFQFIIFKFLQEYQSIRFTLAVFFKLLLVKVSNHLINIIHFANKFLSPLFKNMLINVF